jgi:hypothetical protein
MRIKNPHERIDRVNADQDRLIASRLRRDKRVLRLARQNLKRWMAKDGKPRAVFLEWNRILTRLTAAEIADFLVSDTPMARRLSQSSPFPGVLSDRERMAIWRKHEKARA